MNRFRINKGNNSYFCHSPVAIWLIICLFSITLQSQAQTALPKPSAPTGLTATAATGSISLSWTAPAGDGHGALGGYNIYRCDESSSADCSDFPWLAWVAVPGNTEYTDSAITAGTTYRYAVAAYRHDGTSEENNSSSDWSSIVTQTVQMPPAALPKPSAPTGLTATAATGSISLSWTAPAGDGHGALGGYNIYRCDESSSADCSDFPWLAWVAVPGNTEYTDSAITAGTTYRYAVAAYRHDGTSEENNSSSDWSNEVAAMIAANQSPVFSSASYTFDLPENQDRGWSTSARRLYANDPDGDNAQLSYALTAGNPSCRGCGIGIKNPAYHNTLFRVNKTPEHNAYIVYQGKGEDYESFTSGAAYYTLTLTATDEDGATATVTVTINITDVQEPAGNQSPVFSSANYTFDLPENQGRGWSTPARRLYANDPDGDNAELSYALTAGNPSCRGCGIGIKNPAYHNTLFRVNKTPEHNAYIVYQGKGEDYESFTSGAAYYTLTLTATDKGGSTATVTVTINITDVEEEIAASFAAGLQWIDKDAFPELSGVTTWNSVAWKGERIQQHILIKSAPSYDQVSLSVSDLEFETSDPDSDVSPIPASTVSFRHPHFVKGDTEVRTCEGYSNRDTNSYGTSYLSDALFSEQQTTQSIDLQSHTVSSDGTNVKVDTQPPSWTVPVWLAVDIPRDTQPGTYSGTVTLSAVSTTSNSAMAQTRLQVSIEVVPWSLPLTNQRQFHLDLWQLPIVALDKYNTANPDDRISQWSEGHYGLLEPFYRDLARLGQRTVSTRAQTMVQWTKTSEGGLWEYDYSVFDAHVNKLASWGIDHQISAFAIAYWREENADEFPYWDAAAQEKKLFRADIGSSVWKERWNHFLTDFKNHLVAKGWFNKTVLFMDEVPEASMQAVIDLIQGNDTNWKIGLAYGHAPGAHILRELDDSSNTILPAGTRYADVGLTTGMTYRYAVQACNTAGCGDWSDRVTMVTQTPAVPGSPTGLTAAATDDGVVRLNWTAPAASGSSPLTGYNVYRCVDGAEPCAIPTYHAWVKSGASTTYVDNGLTAGTTYRYEVDACNESGCSDRTDPVGIIAQSQATPPSGGTQTDGSTPASGSNSASTNGLPGAPTGLTAVAASSTAIQLIWKTPAVIGSSALSGYNVYRCAGSGCTLTGDDYLAWTTANERDGRTYSDQVTTFYTSCFQTRPNSFVATDANPVDMAALPWHALERHHDGYSRWAYDNWQSADPLDLREGFFTAGDYSMIYRSSNDRDMTVVPSIRLEALREGMEDFEKMQVLRTSLSTCSAGGLSSRWLSRLERTVDTFTSGALMAGRAGSLINQAHTQLDEISQQLSPAICQ